MQMAKAESRALVELCRRVQAWRDREGGGRGKRVPNALWKQAVAVARIDGLQTTARATRLNYDRLKKRISDEDKRDRARGAGGAAVRRVARASAHRVAHQTPPAPVTATNFVALKVAPNSASQPTTIEVVGRHGDRMRVEVHGEVDLRGLVQAFGSMQL
jgi:hypothetical protein